MAPNSRPSRSQFRTFDSQGHVPAPSPRRPVQDVWPSRCDRATIEGRMRAKNQEVDIYEPLHSQNLNCPYVVCYFTPDGIAHHYNIEKQAGLFYINEGQGIRPRRFSSLLSMLEHLRIYQYSPGGRSDPTEWQNLPVQNMVSESAESLVPAAAPSVSQPQAPIVRRSSSAFNRTQATSSHPSAPRPSLSVDQALSQLTCYRSDLPEWAMGVTLAENSLPFLVTRQSQTHQPVLVYFTGHMQQLPIRQNTAQEFYIDHPTYRECHFRTMAQLLRYHKQHGLLSCPTQIHHLYLDHTH